MMGASKDLARLGDKPPTFTIKILSADEQCGLDYYKMRIEELERQKRLIQKELDNTKPLKDQIQQLETFKNLFMLQCPLKRFNRVSLIQCSEMVRKGECLKFCHDRKNFQRKYGL